MQKKQIFKM